MSTVTTNDLSKLKSCPFANFMVGDDTVLHVRIFVDEARGGFGGVEHDESTVDRVRVRSSKNDLSRIRETLCCVQMTLSIRLPLLKYLFQSLNVKTIRVTDPRARVGYGTARRIFLRTSGMYS